MNRLTAIVAASAGALIINGCVRDPNTGYVGISPAATDPAVLSCAGGALIGIIIANQITDIRRSSKESAWKIGAGLGGCASGASIYSAVHPQDIHETVLHNQTGQASSWASEVNGQTINYTITPTSEVTENTTGSDGKYYSGCRDYVINTINPETNTPVVEKGEACMNDRGEMVLLTSVRA